MTDLSGPTSRQPLSVIHSPAPMPQGVGPFGSLVASIQMIATVLSALQQTITKSFIALSGNNTFTGSNTFDLPVILPTYTVASLPAAAAANKGAKAFVSDATTTTFGGALTGGGSNFVPVFSTGSAWLIG